MIWKAWLTGHEFDLHELGQLFSSGDSRVIKDGDSYYLASTEIDSRPTGESYYEAAAHVLALVNGVGQANNSSFRPVGLDGHYSEGDRRHVAVLAGTAEARTYVYGALTAIGPDGAVVPPPPPLGPGRVDKATRHPDAAEALGIMGKPEPTSWVDLYKVYEIVRDGVKPTRLENSGFATKDDLSAFTGSANLPSVSGKGARHARMAGAPKRSMTIAEARDFIGRMLNAWLDSLQ